MVENHSLHSVCMPRTSLLGTIEIASSLIVKIRIKNDDSSKDQFLLKKHDVFSRRNSQELSAELKNSGVYSRRDGSTECLLEKPESYSRRNGQGVYTEVSHGFFSARTVKLKIFISLGFIHDGKVKQNFYWRTLMLFTARTVRKYLKSWIGQTFIHEGTV